MTEAKMIVRGKEVRFLDKDDARARIDRAGQIPNFPDEAAERAWWGEHTLSEGFWRNAESVPADELPPVRHREPQSGTARASSTLPPAVAFAAGFMACAALLGVAYLVYRLTQADLAAAEFLSTKASYLRVLA